MENKKQQLKKLKNERGLTLVELLAVIVILGIIGTIAFVYIGGVIDNSKKDAQVANAQQIIAAAKLYEMTEGAIETDGVTVEKLIDEKYLEEVIDPWEKKSIVIDKSLVTKVGDDYKVTIEVVGDKGNIDEATEAQLRGDDSVEGDKGRDLVE